MLSDNLEYSFFISSETAEYNYESYYKVVAGTVRKNELNYYNIDEIRCFLVSLDGRKVFLYDKENESLKSLNTIYDIEIYLH